MAGNNKLSFIDRELEHRRQRNTFRTLGALEPGSGARVRDGARDLDNFCSNDYLGLSQHPLLKQRAREYVERYGAGSTASRLICGTTRSCLALEEKLARLKATEAALVLSTGYQANTTILPALVDRRSLILSDWLNHSSLISGALLSRCRVVRFRHNDLNHLQRLLEEHRAQGHSRMVIVTESVFSMDGDRADLDSLVSLADEFEALLVVDEAHATGLFGPRGMGLTVGRGVDLAVGTFGKALGVFGAYVACSRKMRDYLVNCCAGFLYTTALPPAVLGAVDAALDLIPGMDQERAKLQSAAAELRRQIRGLGYDPGESTTQIVPLIVGQEAAALKLSARLRDKGILVAAIRPPTVPKGGARLRLTLSAVHTEAQLRRLVDALRTGVNK